MQTVTSEAEWDSQLSVVDHNVPESWALQLSKDTVALRCMFGTYSSGHALVSPGTFRYRLPRKADSLSIALINDAREVVNKIIVKLYAIQNARTHYMGEWLVSEVECATTQWTGHVLVLKRSSHQRSEGNVKQLDGALQIGSNGVSPRFRSKSEARHYMTLRTIFQSRHGWCIAYEPSCITNLYAPLVQGGELNQFGGSEYTIDFVVTNTRSAIYVAVESKCDMQGLTARAVEKCRTLRACTGQRVLAIVGHDADFKCFDFGTCQKQETIMTKPMLIEWALTLTPGADKGGTPCNFHQGTADTHHTRIGPVTRSMSASGRVKSISLACL